MLTAAMLSDHAIGGLNAKAAGGNNDEKKLALLAKRAIGSGQLQISSTQRANSSVAQFGMQRGSDVLAIMVKLNERSTYDILRVGLRSGAQAPLSLVLPGPSTAVAGAARAPAGLLSLPNELLINIARGTSETGIGVDPNLRRVNKRMTGIANDQMSPRQKLLTENAQTLHASGYGRVSIESFLGLNDDQQRFVLTRGPTLRATAGYDGYTLNHLARSTLAVQAFARTHGPWLHSHAGYIGESINNLAEYTPAMQSFVGRHGQNLHSRAGYDGFDLNALAGFQPANQQFVLTHGIRLHEEFHYAGSDINALAIKPAAEQSRVLANGPRPHASDDDRPATNPWAGS